LAAIAIPRNGRSYSYISSSIPTTTANDDDDSGGFIEEHKHEHQHVKNHHQQQQHQSSSLSTTTTTTAQQQPDHNEDAATTGNKDTCLHHMFHEVCFIETMRHWQAWKFSLVEGFCITVLQQVGIAIVTICSAYVVMEGYITIGNFTTLLGCVSNIASLGERIGSFLTGLYENHIVLKQISCIINDEDITFDGGVDVFEEKLQHLHVMTKKVGNAVGKTTIDTFQKVKKTNKSSGC
jgi:ABC-type bacteriocin/lantibiotic exporter with double-glycine peptidase domain